MDDTNIHRLIEVRWDSTAEPWFAEGCNQPLELPELVIVPSTLPESDIDGWLTAKFGFAHFGWDWHTASTDTLSAFSADPM